MGAEADISGKLHCLQPEFCRKVVPVHMDMGRLVRLMAVEVEFIRPDPQYRRHAVLCLHGGVGKQFLHFVLGQHGVDDPHDGLLVFWFQLVDYPYP